MRSRLTALAVVLILSRTVSGTANVTPPPAPHSPPTGCPNTPASLFVPLATSIGGIVVDPACQYVYLTNTSLNRVEIFSLQTLTLQTPIPVGSNPMGLDVTDDGGTLYVANSGGNNISVVDLIGRTELRRITVPDVSNFSPYSIAIANNGLALFSTSNSIGSIKQLNLATDQVTNRTDFTVSGVPGTRMPLKASRDRGTIAIVGQNSSAPLLTYRSSTNTFLPPKYLAASASEAAPNGTGSKFLMTAGSLVVDDSPSMTGTIIGGAGFGGGEIDPTRPIGYRAVGTTLEILNLDTFLKVDDLPLGDSISSASFSNKIGRMDLNPDGTLLAVITNNGFSIVRPLAEAPSNVNLVLNGGFADRLDGWQTFATPDSTHMQFSVTNGVFQFNRIAPQDGSSNQALLFQESGLPLPAGAPIQARFALGNTSDVRKRISVLLIDADFSDLHVCTFWVPAHAALAWYRMRSHTTKAWTNAAIYFYAATAGADNGFSQIDDISIQYDPTFTADVTECVDPTAPAAPGGPDEADWIVNGDFGTGVTAPWVGFGTITTRVAGGVMEFTRDTSTPPAGAVLQPTGQTLATNDILTASLDLGNSSTVRKRVTVILHDLDFSDLAACTFWLAPGQDLSTYTMQAFATKPWANVTLSIYAATVGTEGWTRLDNVHLRRTPAATITGTNCIEPAAGGANIQEQNAVAAAAINSVSSATTTTTAGSSAPLSAVAPAISDVAGPPASKPMLRSVLEIGSVIDLTGADSARLRLESWLSTDGRGEIQITLDGVTWVSVADVTASSDWADLDVDLSAWAGELLMIRFVHNGEPGDTDAVWRLRNLRIATSRR